MTSRERPDGWPEMFPEVGMTCPHQFQWDDAEGIYRCVMCDLTRETPRETFVDGGVDG